MPTPQQKPRSCRGGRERGSAAPHSPQQPTQVQENCSLGGLVGASQTMPCARVLSPGHRETVLPLSRAPTVVTCWKSLLPGQGLGDGRCFQAVGCVRIL